MSDAATTPSQGEEVGREELLLRLVWDPDDIDPVTKELQTSAFPKGELESAANGISVDRRAIASKVAIQFVASKQQAKASGHQTLVRNTPLLAEACTGDVLDQNFDDGAEMFSVISTPIHASDNAPANPAHCDIVNISGRTKRSAINQLRTKLQSLFSQPLPLENFFPQEIESNSN